MDDEEMDIELFDADGNPDEEAVIAYLAYLDNEIEKNEPGQFFIPLFLAVCLDFFDVPIELFFEVLPSFIPVFGMGLGFAFFLFTMGITLSEGFVFWLVLLGKGTFLRTRMRFWMWVATFFEAFVPWAGLLPMRTLVISRFAAKNKKKYNGLVAERDQIRQLLAYIQSQEVANDNVPYSATPSMPPSQTTGMDSVPSQALTRGNLAPRPAANDNASQSRAA